MKRKSLSGDRCAVARSLDVIGDWWSLLIVRDVFSGIRRFNDIARNLGAAKNILTTRMKSLVANGILQVGPATDGTSYQEYFLTDKGERLLPVLVALAQWGGEHLFDEGEKGNVVLDAQSLRPLGKLELRSADGRVLDTRDVLVGHCA